MKKIYTILASLTSVICFGQTFNFELQSSGTTEDLNGIVFKDASNTAWICGEGSTILKTTDGSSWTALNPGVTAFFYGIDHLNDSGTSQDHVWSCGSNGTIIHSSDGGTSWTTQAQGAPAAMYSLDFTSLNNGIATGDQFTVNTVNGGSSWTPVANPGNGTMNAVSCVPGTSTAVRVGGNGQINRTTDGGTTWSSVSDPTTNHLIGVHMVNASMGWACGANGTILKTIDGGLTWTDVPTATTTWFNAIQFFDANNGVVCGTSGQLLQTTDGGATWTQYPSGTTVHFNDLYFTSMDEGWIVGDVGTIYKFTKSSSGVGIDETSLHQISIYPNPTNAVLNIKATENTAIKIVNVLGETVATQTLHTGSNSMDVTGLTNGVYFIHSSDGGMVKFVKE